MRKRGVIKLVIALFLISLFNSFVNLSQAKAVAPSPSWWNSQICDTNRYPGSYQLSSGAVFNGVVACGPGPLQGGVDTLVNFGAGASENEWECVELSMRYMYLAYGIAPYLLSGNAATIVSDYSGTRLTAVNNNGQHGLPTPGDIIAEAATSSNMYGHTAIVTAVNVSGGTGTVTILQQNVAGNNGIGTISVSGGILGSNVTGWLHDPQYHASPAHPGLLYADAYGSNAQLSTFRANQGAWQLSDVAQNWGIPQQLVAGDFTDSGYNDTAAYVQSSGSGTSTLSTIQHIGSTWTGLYQTGNWGTPYAVVAADLTRDGHDDCIVYIEPDGHGTATVSAFKSAGTSGWTLLWRSYNWAIPQAVVSGDFSSDGYNDTLAYAQSGGASSSVVTTLKSTGSDWTTLFQTPNNWAVPRTMISGDFIGSGHRNSIVYAQDAGGTETITTVKSLGSSGWTGLWQISNWGIPYSLATGDYNVDGNDDMVYVEPDGGGHAKVSVFYSNGSGWTFGWSVQPWGIPYAVAGRFYTAN